MKQYPVTGVVALVLFLLLMLFLIIVISKALIRRQALVGRPPVPVFFFVLAKMCVVVNLVFLFPGGLQVHVYRLFEPGLILVLTAIIFLTCGLTILVISSFQLNRDLMFGLPGEKQDKLQTKGIYALSRHPFYLGFLFILFSSCLLCPNPVNILAFILAWGIHHVIMSKEEDFLEKAYGEEYRIYKERTGRYLTF
jgi:protein-S-isoprenylcysteine O-methyltransferase Ste14